MRIITGKRKGSKLVGPLGENTRPTESRIKESIFNILGNVNDSYVLDLFSGSGSIGLEFLSRGSKEVYLVDNNKNAIKAINTNVKKLNLSGAHVIQSSYLDALSDISKKNVEFDFIYVDPPYDAVDIYDKTLEYLNKYDNFFNSLIIVETKKDININNLKLFNIIDMRQYRDTIVYFLRRQ